MAEVLVTAVAVPNKLYFMRVVQRNETGSIVSVLFTGDVIATTQESARAVAYADIIKNHPDADLTRIGLTVSELNLS